MNINSQSPLIKRLWAYLLERFPPGAYTLLVLLFWGSAVGTVKILSDFAMAASTWLIVPVIWLVFLRLRLFDESKDHTLDKVAHPDRILSKGIVSLSLLKRVSLMALLLEGGVSFALGQDVLLCWFGVVIFTFAMRIEFGVSGWLNKHIFIYAISHNPVVAGLGILCWASTGAPWSSFFVLYLLSISFSSLAFEFGRKINTPEEELVLVQSYSSVFGRAKSVFMLRTAALLSTIFTLWLLLELSSDGIGFGEFLAFGVLIFGLIALSFLSSLHSSSSKVELGGTLFLLFQMLSVIIGTVL